MKKLNKFIFLTVLAVSLFIFAGQAFAATPVLTLSNTGSGDNVQINVTGDSSASVLLFTGSQTIVLGSTNTSGNLSVTISSATYNIVSNAVVFVKTGGLNGTQSANANWPYIQSTSSSNNNFTLSQSALLMNIGQTSTITASSSYIYLLSNSNPSIANINLNANQITVTANTYGSTVANICIVGSTTNCANINITVQSSGASQLTFSQNNFSIYSGQNVVVTVTGGSGFYMISNNSNPTAVQANLSGSTVTLSTNGSVGTAAITVCTTDLNNCGIINVNSTTVSSTAVTFSQTNPVVQIGQSGTVTIYGGTGNNFYVSANSNPSIVQANITNNVLTLIGNAAGTSTINICAYAGTCGSLIANVSATSINGQMSLSQNSISILSGQSSAITILGGSTPYNISAPALPNIFNGVVNGNILTVYGVNPGSTTASVCSSIGCVTLSVTVNSVNASINPPIFSENNISMNIGQQKTVYVTGNGNYYISNNNNSNAISASISGSAIVITANSTGSSSVSICQNGGQCAVLYITVSAQVTPIVTPIFTPVVSQPVYNLLRYLGAGDKGDDVYQLQKFLVEKGYLTATPNGLFGPATKAAIKKFQKISAIKQTGSVGPATKDAINKILSSAATPSVSTKEQQIQTIQQAIQQLLAQLAQMQGK